MFRKLTLLLSVVVMLSMAVVVSAQDAVNGCYASPTTVTINEGVSTTVTFECANIPVVTNRVFGFQMGTSIPASGVGADYVSLPGTYTEGQFSEAGFGATSGVMPGSNTLSLYGLSRYNNQIVNAEDFTLGSYSLTADTNNTVDGSIAITFVDDTFKLSNDLGAPLSGWLRTDNDTIISVNNIDLAWLMGNTTIQSDSTAIGKISSISLDLGGNIYTPLTNTVPLASTLTAYTVDLNINSAYTYVEDASGVVVGQNGTEEFRIVAQDGDGALNVAVTADMFGHLACSTPIVDLGDTGAAQNVSVFSLEGITLKAGDITSVLGDTEIDLDDATAMGAAFGSTTTAADINIDGTVNIFDLVHVGRNYDAVQQPC